MAGPGPRLELRQSQTLVMTPQLQQAIKLLQLSNLDLADYVEQELSQNPLLEVTEREPRAGDDAPEPVREVDGSAETDLSKMGLADTEHETPLDMNVTEALGADEPVAGAAGNADPFMRTRNTRNDFSSDEYDLEQSLTHDISLKDHLMGQINLDVPDPVDRLIAAQLVDMVNDAGYLEGEIAAVADAMGCEVARVEQTLATCQAFDPPGVFARGLGECLGLQLRERNRLDPAMQKLLERLDLLARGDIAALMRHCSVDAEDITEMIAEIKALNPKPGLAFGTDVAQTVVPDVFVRPRPGGGWMVELNSETLPSVLVNTRYYSRISAGARSDTDKAYLSEKLNSANWLVKSLDQRANTILKVATEIVAQQEGFFLFGVSRLRPLNLRDIATVIQMHESTVSRVTANKHMATPRGIYPMKYFFTSAIQSTEGGGETHSAESVRARIKTLIDREEPDAVLSDDKIVEILRTSEIDIARRTVAKYREALRIPSSVDRRRLKRKAS